MKSIGLSFALFFVVAGCRVVSDENAETAVTQPAPKTTVRAQTFSQTVPAATARQVDAQRRFQQPPQVGDPMIAGVWTSDADPRTRFEFAQDGSLKGTLMGQTATAIFTSVTMTGQATHTATQEVPVRIVGRYTYDGSTIEARIAMDPAADATGGMQSAPSETPVTLTMAPDGKTLTMGGTTFHRQS